MTCGLLNPYLSDASFNCLDKLSNSISFGSDGVEYFILLSIGLIFDIDGVMVDGNIIDTPVVIIPMIPIPVNTPAAITTFFDVSFHSNVSDATDPESLEVDPVDELPPCPVEPPVELWGCVFPPLLDIVEPPPPPPPPPDVDVEIELEESIPVLVIVVVVEDEEEAVEEEE